MADVIKQQPVVTEQFTQDTLAKSGVKAGSAFIKAISDQVLSLVSRAAAYNFKQRYKEAGAIGIVSDAVGSIFKKTKKPSITQDAIDKSGFKEVKATSLTKQSTEEQSQLNFPFLKDTEPKETKLTETKEAAKEVLIAGLTPDGVANLKDKLPEIFKEVFELLPQEKPLEEKKEKFSEGGLLGLLPKSIQPLLGGATLILGGLAALVGAFSTQGALKGSLELIGKAGLQGGLKMVAKKLFTKSLEKVLGKIPIIGSVISFGFAIQRFMNGDIVGGFLSLAAGLANLIPGVGFVVGIGIDVIQAILDAKTGGSSAESSAKKTGLLLGWAKKIGSLLYRGLKSLPIIGPAIKAIEEFTAGNYLKGIKQLAYIATPLEFIGALLGDKEASGVTKTVASVFRGIGSVVKWLGSLIYKGLKSLPIIGPAIKAIEEFSKGNYLKGIKQLAYIATPLEFIGALLGDKEASGITKTVASVFRGIGSVIKWLGSAIYKGVKSLPIIGPAIKAIEEFSKGNYLKGFKQLAYIITPLEFIGALLGDEEASGLTKTSAGIFKGIGSIIKSIGGWIFEKIKDVPVLGPLIKAVEEFSKGNILKGFKQFAYIIPIFEAIGSLLGDKETTSVTGGVVDIVKKIGKWAYEKVRDVPILGPMIKAVEEFSKGNILKGFKQLAYINPFFEVIGSLLGDKETTGASQTGASALKSIGSFFSKIKEAILKSLLNLIPEKILGISVRSRVASLLGINMGPVSDDKISEPTQNVAEPKTSQTKSSSTSIKAKPDIHQPQDLSAEELTKWTSSIKGAQEPLTPMADGGIVTKPTPALIGEAGDEAVIPLEKYLNPSDFSLNNNTLDKIASNTGSTNDVLKMLSQAIFKLAQAYETKGKTASNNIIVNGQQQNPVPSASQVAAANIDPIRRIRAQFAI